MKKVKTKQSISIAINIELYDYLKENISNRSKYIEWLIYQDLKEKDLLKKELYIWE
jgi:hypothetical protein